MSATKNRQQIAKTKALKIWREQSGRCYWCGCEIGLLRVLGPNGWVQTKMWLVGPNGEKIKQATVDHVVPRSEGGGDQRENLVLACSECNSKRNRLQDSKAKKCRRCGKEVISKRRHCPECRRYFRDSYFGSRA